MFDFYRCPMGHTLVVTHGFIAKQIIFCPFCGIYGATFEKTENWIGG
jgi:hypothetical protein